VLKGSDDGILVYVAPTKALVNQIAAEVISRFRKNYKTSGKTVWAIHTRDYRIHNPNNCQILITVPHILSIMLLSPSNAEKWSPRVKRIIFDEVHSIGNAEDGVVWEQLLLLAPCPIIALSATVGNSEEFNAWLKGTQRSKLTMIKHEHRYSDLRKFVYYPPAKSTAKEPFSGLPSVEKFGYLDGAPGLEVIHPIASLVDATQEIPDDLALEPRDCISLYKCMKTLETKDYRVPEHLDYHQIFGKSGMVIKKADVIPWEADLKKVLKHWMCDENSPFKRLIKKLESNISPLPVMSGFPPPTKDASNTANDSENDDPLLKWGTLSLLSTLHAENALPAILFSYDRKLCDSICLSLCEQLERGEKDWRSKDQGWQTKIKEWEAWKKAKASRALKPRKLDLQGKTKTDIMIEEAQKEHHPFESFDPLDPSPAFTFADTKKCSQAELEEEIKLLNPGLVSSPLVQALQRGIGVHHAGLNLKYRQA
jgi:superfamily II RNA helicase